MIYLDHAAATPVSEKVYEAMKPYFLEEFYNPSSAYLPAKKVASDYENAKGVIAHAIGAKASDLVITAGATEANNLAFTSVQNGQIPHSGPRPAGPSPRAAGATPRLARLRTPFERPILTRLCHLGLLPSAPPWRALWNTTPGLAKPPAKITFSSIQGLNSELLMHF